MFRIKRADTRIGTIEQEYGVNLNTRADTLLSNLLEDRGFESLSQLIDAYRGHLTYHPTVRRLFLSFHAEDRSQVQGFKLMARNPNVDLQFYDASLRVAIDSQNSSYVRRAIRDKIAGASILVCLIGNGTAWREWVDWEIRTAHSLGKGLCGVKLKGARGRIPRALVDVNAPIARWDVSDIIRVIETAAARRD